MFGHHEALDRTEFNDEMIAHTTYTADRIGMCFPNFPHNTIQCGKWHAHTYKHSVFTHVMDFPDLYFVNTESHYGIQLQFHFDRGRWNFEILQEGKSKENSTEQ